MTPDQFKERFGTPAHPSGDPVLLAAEILRLRATLNDIRRKAVAESGIRDVTRQLGEIATDALKP